MMVYRLACSQVSANECSAAKRNAKAEEKKRTLKGADGGEVPIDKGRKQSARGEGESRDWVGSTPVSTRRPLDVVADQGM